MKNSVPHVGIYGRSNNGKSSFINSLLKQDIAIVSEIAGTTTDPVKKTVEIFGIGPVVLIDTAGYDDNSKLGEKRKSKTFDSIKQIDCAILIITNNTFCETEKSIIKIFKNFHIPYFIIHNKSDLNKLEDKTINKIKQFDSVDIADFNTINISTDEIIKLLKKNIPDSSFKKNNLLDGIVKPSDIVLLVTPIDSEAPSGRMILPQVMSWRSILDNNCICMSVKETELEQFLSLNIKPNLVITDSQVFDYVSKVIPQDIKLTSFSILFSRLKGNFEKFIEGTPFIDKLKDNDNVLILESCTHQVSCEDIGQFKLPNWIKNYSKKNLNFEFISGLSPIPEDFKKYSIIIQCGGCMSTSKQIASRLKIFIDNNIPITNYGMAIAYINGIFSRVVEPFNVLK